MSTLRPMRIGADIATAPGDADARFYAAAAEVRTL